MTLDQVAVSPVQFFNQLRCWHTGEFSTFSPIAALAGEDQIPDAVHWQPAPPGLQDMRKEMIDLSLYRGIESGQPYLLLAVETVSLLVTIE
ncbi:hypothetical protein GCM10022631_24950 [Deinococcus rubellus]